MDQYLLEKVKYLEEEHYRYIECDKHLREVVQTLVSLKSVTLEATKLWDIDHEKVKNLTQINRELTEQNTDLVSKLNDARKLLYDKDQLLKLISKERNKLLVMLTTAKDVLLDDNCTNETRAKLSFLNLPSDNPVDKMDPIVELSSTDRLMSELSYTFGEDDSLKDTSLRRSHRNKRPPTRFPSDETLDVSGPKKSKGKSTTSTYIADRDDHIVATTTVTVPHLGPISATSVIESIPSTSKNTVQYMDPKYLPSAPPLIMDTDSESTESDGPQVTPKRPFTCQTNVRLHSWIQKSHIMGESCSVCSKKMKFSTVAVKCSNCRAIAHNGCKDKVQLPCVPTHTPNTKASKAGSIADYVPQTSPMVPALVVHCIREIEARGLNEIGLYRVPGSDREVKTLKEKLLKAKGIVDLSNITEIHTITGCLKDFLRSLKEQLLPRKQWKALSSASDIKDSEQRKNKLFKIVSDLPQPNRDTLSYIILHLQRVAASPNCKMPIANLSKMFGPSIVGYSSNNAENMLMETNISNKVMADLLLLPTECWEKLLYPDSDENKDPEIVKTPSQSSLLGFFSNSSSSIRTVKKYKFFENL